MTAEPVALLDPTNDAEPMVSPPWHAEVRIRGSAPVLFHRWSNEAVAAKAAAAKNSRTKKSDNVESYVYRDGNGLISMPGEYLRQSVIGAGRYMQDPRSPRKSAMDLLKAAVLVGPELAPLTNGAGKPAEQWDYLDRRRAVVQRSGITRERPALGEGWSCTFTVTSLLAEYLTPSIMLRLLGEAGRSVGLADFRPSFGRFDVVAFEVLTI